MTSSEIASSVFERWNPILENISVSEHLDDEIEELELSSADHHVINQELHIHITQTSSNRFTWRDLITVAGLLLTFLSWYDASSSQKTTVAHELQETSVEAVQEARETLESIFNFIVAYFPGSSGDREDVQEPPSTP